MSVQTIDKIMEYLEKEVHNTEVFDFPFFNEKKAKHARLNVYKLV